AVNKQVGAAAFVVKDWVDQATQRMDGYLAKMESNSERALAAVEARSMDFSKVVMQKVEQESEALVTDLRRRIQSAALALTQGFAATEDSRRASFPAGPSEQEQLPDAGGAERVRD
ncbi:MAG: hypothetical protein ACRD10_10875, partial [Terriglobia bacterium]